MLLVASILLAPAADAHAQVVRNGNVYGFQAHQPTQGATVWRERRARIAPAQAQAPRNARSVRQLDHKLLHEETAPLLRDPVSSSPP